MQLFNDCNKIENDTLAERFVVVPPDIDEFPLVTLFRFLPLLDWWTDTKKTFKTL